MTQSLGRDRDDVFHIRPKSLPLLISVIVIVSGIVASYAVAQYQISELREETQNIKTEVRLELAELHKKAALTRESIVAIESDVRWIRATMERDVKVVTK